MRNSFAIIAGKMTYLVSQLLKLGAGGTWPGEIALSLSPGLLTSFSKQFKKGIIVVAGTNGKTTTSLMIKQILERQGFTTIHNETGANLLNGIVSAFIKESDWFGKVHADWGIFEVDENSLPQLLNQMTPQIIVLLNLFRDQLDRYGEVDVIAEKWSSAFAKLAPETIVILNSDDPQIAHLGSVILEGAKRPIGSHEIKDSITSSAYADSFQNDVRFIYFGINDKNKYLKQKEHATDSIFCLNCGGRLTYEGIYYSHIGIWKCEQCGEKRPQPELSSWSSPLPGLYNLYNTLAAAGVGKSLKIKDEHIKQALADFKPAFGRQEEFIVDGPTSPLRLRGASKKIKLFLSKNPAGFNQSLRTVIELGAKQLLLVLNDRIPDGLDVSWIWDVDFETIPDSVHIVVSGDRVFDMALRIKYTGNYKNLIIESKLTKAIELGLSATEKGKTLYILLTYSAMLECRKIITGKKIL